ncbi:hypothetical protein M9458_043652, partial [Cirrhinus mrigala]
KVYSDEFLHRCCVDGMREIPMPYSCYRRSRYITEDWSCVLAFLRCCAEYRGEELGAVIRPPTATSPPIVNLPPVNSKPVFSLDRVHGHVDEHYALGVETALRGTGYDEKDEEEEEFSEEDLADLGDVYVRSKFFESWLWTYIRLPSVTKSDG